MKMTIKGLLFVGLLLALAGGAPVYAIDSCSCSCNPGYCGTENADTISGGSGWDCIYGDGGADTIYGNGYGDDLNGGTGADTIYGGSGNDDICGGSENDNLYGDSGSDDSLNGETGTDYCDGERKSSCESGPPPTCYPVCPPGYFCYNGHCLG